MNFFKAYDMRGEFGKDFTVSDVYRIGSALPKVVKGTKWLVGRDARVSSSEMHDALVAGLKAAGAEVTDLGLATTSMVYYFTGEDDFDGSVMITASHNPPKDNGLKVSGRTALPISYSTGLNEVERLVLRDTAPIPPFAEAIPFDKEKADVYRRRYLEFMKGKLVEAETGNLKFAVDCSNGMAALFVRDLFEGSVIINETIDGRFPAHAPNPLKAEAREQIAAVVRAMGLDCGVIFDGDADRAMFVDERGEFVQSDYLIPLIAARGKIIHDVRTSRGTIETLREAGCEPVTVPVGAALAKPILRKIGATCGGELAGHYYFAEFHGCDSGILAAIRILQAIAAAKKKCVSFSELVRPIVSRYANSGELNYKVEDKEGAIGRVLKAAETFGDEIGRETMDGIRIDYPEGWISVRKSNTEPYLRLIAEHRDAEELKIWVKNLEDAIYDR